jgi:fused signal recognition particle receptor
MAPAEAVDAAAKSDAASAAEVKDTAVSDHEISSSDADQPSDTPNQNASEVAVDAEHQLTEVVVSESTDAPRAEMAALDSTDAPHAEMAALDSTDAPHAEMAESESTDAPRAEVAESESTDAPRAEVAESGSTDLFPAESATALDQPLQASDKTAQPEAEQGWYSRLKQGLSRTRGQLSNGLGAVFLGRKTIDAELIEELETILLMADVGIETTNYVLDTLTTRVSRQALSDSGALLESLKQTLIDVVAPSEESLTLASQSPTVILMVGVNGAGKTTTIGKLAQRYRREGRSVMLAAGDTFRAAAVEQLQAWGERNQVPVIAQHTGADSASVIFDAVQSARARGVDVLIADTAGRLHNKDNLMEELKKVVRVIKKIDPLAPHEVMLVLDATMGQNAVAQAEHFKAAVDVTGITLTKLDGTAKGGVVFAIAHTLGIPIRFVGVGEALEDLRPFQAKPFVEALFDETRE